MVQVPGYTIEHLLSWGSQGDVFLARDAAGRRVALKLVSAQRSDGDPHGLQRLEREARLLAKVGSEHVVELLDFVRGDGWAALVLEFLDGQRLDQALRARAGDSDAAALPTGGTAGHTTAVRPVTLEAAAGGAPAKVQAPPPFATAEHVAWALDIGVQVATGLAELHRLQLLHRDLKPQNVMLVGGRAVLIDFGFARQDGVTTLTETGAAIGTLAYMSPEQFHGRVPTARSDVFALGAILFHVLCGAPPGGSHHESLVAMASQAVGARVAVANPAVDRSLANVVQRCLALDPEDRYPDAAAVLADLQRCRDGISVRRPTPWRSLWSRYRRKAVAGAVVAAGVVAAVALGVWALRGDSFDAARIAGSILAARTGDSAARQQAWVGCDDAERAAVVSALNARLGADVGRATEVARALGLGLLHTGARPGHWIAVVAAVDDERVPVPAAHEFVSTELPRCLLVRPGRAWVSIAPQRAAAPRLDSTARCLRALVDVPVPAVVPPPRPLAALPTEFSPLQVPAAVFAAGQHPVNLGGQGTSQHLLVADLEFACRELSRRELGLVRRFLAPLVDRRRELEAWLPHPDEPPGEAETFWSCVQAEVASPAGGELPAMVTFWEAHRLAMVLGGRLPTLTEWRLASSNDGAHLGSQHERRVEADLQPASATPTWDCTTKGVCFANSNAREWLVQTAVSGRARSVPMQAKVEGVLTHSWMFHAGASDPSRTAGVRLCRETLPSP